MKNWIIHGEKKNRVRIARKWSMKVNKKNKREIYFLFLIISQNKNYFKTINIIYFYFLHTFRIK